MWELPCGSVVGSHPDRLVRPDSRWKSGAGAASIARGWRRPGAESQLARYASMAELRREMHPRGHGCAMPLDRRAAGADRTRCAKRPITGVVDIRYGRRRPRETSGTFAGHEGTEKASCIEAETVVAIEAVAVAWEASRAVRSTDTVTATPSAPNKRPAAHVEFDTPRSPQATARQLHRGASRSNAGPNRLRRKTADRPATLNDPRRPGPLTRRRARQIPRAPHRPPMRLPVSRPAAVRGPSYRIDKHAVVDAIGGEGAGPGSATAPYRPPPTAA